MLLIKNNDLTDSKILMLVRCFGYFHMYKVPFCWVKEPNITFITHESWTMKGCLNQFQNSFNPHYIIKLKKEDQSTANKKKDQHKFRDSNKEQEKLSVIKSLVAYCCKLCDNIFFVLGKPKSHCKRAN